MPHETAAAAFERSDHGVDVLGAREQEHRRGLLGNLGADLVEERVVKMGDVLALDASAHDASRDEPDGEPRRTEQRPDHGAGQGSLRRSLADHVALLVDIDVATRERAAHDDPVVPVVLDAG
jgi:hypothetical protein